MGRSLNGDVDEKKTEKNPGKESESPTDSDLDEEEFIVEKILKMRTTKKGKVQCKSTDFPHLITLFFHSDLLKWKGFSDNENTWVSKRLRFPRNSILSNRNQRKISNVQN